MGGSITSSRSYADHVAVIMNTIGDDIKHIRQDLIFCRYVRKQVQLNKCGASNQDSYKTVKTRFLAFVKFLVYLQHSQPAVFDEEDQLHKNLWNLDQVVKQWGHSLRKSCAIQGAKKLLQ